MKDEPLFKFPLRIYKDSGTIRIESFDGETVIPEFLWNGEGPHYERQLKKAQEILDCLNSHLQGGSKSDNFCMEGKEVAVFGVGKNEKSNERVKAKGGWKY